MCDTLRTEGGQEGGDLIWVVMRMQPRISFSVDSLLGRKTTRGDGDGDVSKMTMLTELDRNDNQLSHTRELPAAAAASVPPLLLAAVRSHNINHGGEGDHRRRQNSWRDEEEEGAETRFPLSEVFRQPEARGERIPMTMNDSVDCIKQEEEEEEEEESEGELCVDGDEGDEEEGGGGGGGIYEDEDEDPDDCSSPRQSPGRLHPVMPTPLMGRPPHPLSGLPPGLLRPPPWGHPPTGHLALPFGSSLFDKGILLISIIIIVQSVKL